MLVLSSYLKDKRMANFSSNKINLIQPVERWLIWKRGIGACPDHWPEFPKLFEPVSSQASCGSAKSAPVSNTFGAKVRLRARVCEHQRERERERTKREVAGGAAQRCPSVVVGAKRESCWDRAGVRRLVRGAVVESWRQTSAQSVGDRVLKVRPPPGLSASCECLGPLRQGAHSSPARRSVPPSLHPLNNTDMLRPSALSACETRLSRSAPALLGWCPHADFHPLTLLVTSLVKFLCPHLNVAFYRGDFQKSDL